MRHLNALKNSTNNPHLVSLDTIQLGAGSSELIAVRFAERRWVLGKCGRWNWPSGNRRLLMSLVGAVNARGRVRWSLEAWHVRARRRQHRLHWRNWRRSLRRRRTHCCIVQLILISWSVTLNLFLIINCFFVSHNFFNSFFGFRSNL